MKNKIFVFFGIDPEVIEKVDSTERTSFFAVYLLLTIIAIGSFFSTSYLFKIIFSNTFAGYIIGFFWSFIFLNLYRFILFLITNFSARNPEEKSRLFIPHTFKFLIVLFFSIFISFTILLRVHNSYIERKLPAVLNLKIKDLETKLQKINETQRSELEQKIYSLQSQIDQTREQISEQENKLITDKTEILQKEIKKNISALNAELLNLEKNNIPAIKIYTENLNNLDFETKEQSEKYQAIIQGSHLIIERFKLSLDKSKQLGYLDLILCIIICCIPFFFKILTSKSTLFSYEGIKARMEIESIKSDYFEFRENYKEISKRATGKECEFPEFYHDPPFNKSLIKERIFIEKKGQFKEFLEENSEKETNIIPGNYINF